MILSKFETITVDELLNRLNNYNHKELHVHHTWSPSHKDFNGTNGIRLQEAMERYHMAPEPQGRGWQAIGQHVTLLPDGLFVTGRDFSMTPASITGYNTGAFACEMLGNFDTSHDAFEGKQKVSALKLAAYFDDKGKYIRFHRENSTKTCPGTLIDKNTFMQEVRALGKVFKDVEDNRWSAKYIEAAKNLGLIAGNPDGTFNPEGSLTREQAAVITVRLYEKITGRNVV
ncbi:MAG: hypothetical protein FIA99_05460 [Ruminiclostridium sp.]|nr:hypothetical protein [Ruminiclostridium sp.]